MVGLCVYESLRRHFIKRINMVYMYVCVHERFETNHLWGTLRTMFGARVTFSHSMGLKSKWQNAQVWSFVVCLNVLYNFNQSLLIPYTLNPYETKKWFFHLKMYLKCHEEMLLMKISILTNWLYNLPIINGFQFHKTHELQRFPN